jgi:MOSC domain-containing protein YiiM
MPLDGLYGQIIMVEFGAADLVAAMPPQLLQWKARLEATLGAPPYGRPAREHRPRAALDAALAATAGSPRTARLELIVVRPAIDHRATPAEASLVQDRGLTGDHWATVGKPKAQVSLMDVRVAGAIATRDDWSLFGDNLFVDLDLGEAAVRPGDRLAIGGALLEITDEPHLGCRKLMARFGAGALRWVNARDTRTDRRRGVYARVIESGAIHVGDAVERR